MPNLSPSDINSPTGPPLAPPNAQQLTSLPDTARYSSKTRAVYDLLFSRLKQLRVVLGCVPNIGDCGHNTADQQLRALGLLPPHMTSRRLCSSYYKNPATEADYQLIRASDSTVSYPQTRDEYVKEVLISFKFRKQQREIREQLGTCGPHDEKPAIWFGAMERHALVKLLDLTYHTVQVNNEKLVVSSMGKGACHVWECLAPGHIMPLWKMSEDDDYSGIQCSTSLIAS